MLQKEAGMCLGLSELKNPQIYQKDRKKKWQTGQADLTKSLLLSTILLGAIDSS